MRTIFKQENIEGNTDDRGNESSKIKNGVQYIY